VTEKNWQAYSTFRMTSQQAKKGKQWSLQDQQQELKNKPQVSTPKNLPKKDTSHSLLTLKVMAEGQDFPLRCCTRPAPQEYGEAGEMRWKPLSCARDTQWLCAQVPSSHDRIAVTLAFIRCLYEHRKNEYYNSKDRNMTNYIDGFVLPIPRIYLNEYKKVAEKVAEIWKKYGAIAYFEFVGDDLFLGFSGK